MAEDHPRTLRGLLRVGQRTDHGHVLQALGERQEPAFVPQQHHRPLRGEPRFLAVLGQCDNLRQLRLVGVRLLEEPHTNLDRENGPHGCVDVGQLQCAVLDEPGEVLRVGVAGHVHVEARTQRAEGRVAPVAGEALDDEVPDGHRVADDEALEPPLAPQDVAQQEAVPAGGDIVEVHVGAHKRPDAGLHCGLEGREVDVAQLALGQVDRIVVAPAVRRAVTREVFGTGHDMIGRAERRPLEAAHLGGRHGRTQEGIFAGALDDAAPAGVTGDVEHRAEGPVQACGAGFLGRHGLRPFGNRRIPRRGHGQRHGEDRAVAVDHIEGEEQRDLRRALFDGDLLERVELLRVVEPQDRAGPALADDVLGLRPREERLRPQSG